MAEFDDIDWGDEWQMPLDGRTWLQLLKPIHVLTATYPDDVACAEFADRVIDEIARGLGHAPCVRLLTRNEEQEQLKTMANVAARMPNSHPAEILDGLYHGLDENRLEADEEFSQNVLLLLAILRR